MPRVYEKKADGLREKITVPMTADLLKRLREFAASQAQTPTAAARDLLARALEPQR